MKRYIRTAQSVHTMTYKDVLAELKRCVLRHDTKRMRALSLSRWYDKALEEIRKNMGVSASTVIEAATLDGVFDTSTTHMSYYDNFLNEKDLKYMREAKNLDGKIVYMTPDEYVDECVKLFGRKYTAKQLEQQRSDKLLPEYVEAMKNGDTFPLCFLNYADKGQEGLHRMFAAKKAFGLDYEYPVLVITPYDMDKWNEQKLFEEIKDFERYEFSDVIKDMESDLSDWSIAPPDDLAQQAKAYIENKCKEQGYDVSVNCEINDYKGDLRLDVSLVSYNGHDLDYIEPHIKSPWLGNMFDLDGKSDDDIDDFIDDLTSEEIENFFFK